MSDDLERRLKQLKQALDSGLLDQDTYQMAVNAALGIQQTSVQSGASAAGEGSTAVGEKGVNVAGSVSGSVITGNVYYGEPTDDPDEALRIYRRVLAQSSSHIPLRSVDVAASDATGEQKRLGLAQVYIDLDTTTQVKEDGEGKEGGREETRPLPALEAMVGNRQMVLTGHPGGGKSTFVKHLSHCLAAHALSPEAGWLDHLPQWPQADATLLPVVVILRDFARSLPAPLPHPDDSLHLWTFIERRLKAQNLEFVVKPLARALENGQAILLLDGLDELPSVEQRLFARQVVLNFAARYPRNRYLVTCRILSYQKPVSEEQPDLRLPGDEFPVFELARFDEKKIDDFIEHWYGELARTGSVRVEDVDDLTTGLQKTVRRPDLWRLADNPLLLTVMALVHTHKGQLPDARALLYEETIDILLWRWEQGKGGTRADAPRLRRLMQAAGRTDMDLKKLLWRLAYEAHAQMDEDQDREALAGIGELKLKRALVRLSEGGNDWNWADQMVEVMKFRAGLLLEREPEVFSFPHRTFQEFLAGAHLSIQRNFATQATDLAGEGANWREVILLAAGRLFYLTGDMDKPLSLVNRLCPNRQEDSGLAWSKAWLAGDVLCEIGLKQVKDDAWGQELLDRVRERLVVLVSQGKLAPRQRAEAGDSLAKLGDPRPGVGVHVVNGLTLPDIELCYVPPGPFWMGSGEDDPDAQEREKPLHKLDIPYGYWLGRYPVTVAQFSAFLDESGHKPRRAYLVLADPPNRPVRYVSWDDAIAFCQWLDDMWRKEGWLPEGYSVILPSEAEWEKGARGGVEIVTDSVMKNPGEGLGVDGLTVEMVQNPVPQRRYPWGNEWKADWANARDIGIGSTCAAGAFPGGSSPYGMWDVSGNVWEWTRSRWGKEWKEPDFTYEYNPEDGREDLGSRDLRVLRGGSFFNSEGMLRCASRLRGSPSYDFDCYGFRIAVSPFSFSSGR
jgi:formylglycine-generating enzyme required for sulfatase activity